MRIPYTVAVALELLPAILSLFGFIAYPWGLVVTVFGTLMTLALLVRTVQSHLAERDAFRKKIGKEALGVLNTVISNSTDRRIPCPVWSGNSEGFKAEVLGDGDYKAWEKFYEAVEARNDYFGSRQGFAWPDVEKVSLLCFWNFFKIYDDVSWVRDVIPPESIADLLARAKQSAATRAFTPTPSTIAAKD